MTMNDLTQWVKANDLTETELQQAISNMKNDNRIKEDII